MKTYPPGTVRALLDSDMVTPQTREALRARLSADESYDEPSFLDVDLFLTLRAACARLIPQPESAKPIDCASAIDKRLANGEGDGWRYDALPADGETFRRGLRGLDEAARAKFSFSFHQLDDARQDELLLAVQRGDVKGGVWETLSANLFFEELLAAATEIYYSHPLAQELIGYAGMADAHGWQAIGLDQLEAWEPRASEDTSD
ncbi:MAG: gluconate 2-dehydrogenase subunit 3 family protein [Pyrinomonadaceae bacterium]|nr:gluconate 2-dehydrogenase subunit 3 family protein [Pyrinomonadaceae bacterium]